jgi:CRP/FNR family transcriptional regulator, cyclic AMP receptor protein
MSDDTEIIAAFNAILWLNNLNPLSREKLAAISRIVAINTGDELFHEGAKEDSLYILLDGKVLIEIYIPGRGRIIIDEAKPMDMIGWSAITQVVRERTASARAVSPSRLVCINAVSLYQLCNEDHDLGFVFMHQLSNVVASRLLTTRLQLLDMFTRPSNL